MIVPATPDNIAEAGKRLKNGGLVAFPTETVYGLGADATSDTAVARIFAAKNRPDFNPLIVHVPDLNTAATLAEFTDLGQKIAERFWPGPMSLVLRRKSDCPVSHLAAAGLETIAVRVPANATAQAILGAAGVRLRHQAPMRRENKSHRSGACSGVPGRRGRSYYRRRSLPGRSGIHCGRLHVKTPVVLRPGGVTSEQIESLLDPSPYRTAPRINRPLPACCKATMRPMPRSG